MRPGAAQQFGTGYIRLDAMTADDRTVAALRGALADLDAAGVSGWVLDLRTSAGGDATAAARVAGLFLQPGSMVATLEGRGGNTAVLQTRDMPWTRQLPLVVLVDGNGTARAAEVLAAALQDAGRAVVAGAQTAGCADEGGLVLLLDGSGALLAEERALAGPDQRVLTGNGVTPDLIADRSLDDRLAGHDPQLAAAVAWLSAAP